MNRWFKLGLASAVVAPLVVVGISSYLFHSLTKAKRVRIEDNPSNLGLKYEEVSFPAAGDGLMLRGWYIKAKKSDPCIIMAHGGEYHRADPTIGMLEIAKGLVGHGYNVLTFDLRGHGESGEGRMSAGYYERRDVQGAIAYAKGRGIPPQHIGLLGFSLGAAASLLAVAEDKELATVVTDSCWADPMDLIQRQMVRRRHMPGFLIPILLSIAKAAYRVDFDEVKPLTTVSKIAPRPIFFIHGEFDDTVPVESALRLYHSNENPGNKLWVVPEARHVSSYRARPEEYIARVAAFFDQALK